MRPWLWAIALAVVFAFTIGGPLHTFREYPGGESASVLDVNTGDKPAHEDFDILQALGGDFSDDVPAAAAPRISGDGAGMVDTVVAMADAGAPGDDPVADAVGGPTEDDSALDEFLRPTVSYYTVRRGETLSEIALKFRISPMTILAANDLINANMIQVGQELKILSLDGAIHQVKSGENLWDIARTYRTAVDEIVTVNEISNPNRIRPSQELVIPGVRAAEIGSSIRSERLVSADGRLLPVFDWPVRGRVSSNFGMRWGRMHHGTDIAVNTGTPVRASARGRVSFSGMNGGYGYLVMIDHGEGVETRYAHNSRLLVKTGEYVARGQVIAYSGNTGNSTGPHVHFEIRYKGNSLDPRNYLR